MNYPAKEVAQESGHWYAKDGAPAYTKPNGKPNTLREARAQGLLPSVTSILKVAAAPGLQRWFINQAMDACLTLPRLQDESTDAFKVRALLDSQEQAKRARERGSAFHGYLELALQDKPHAEFGAVQHVLDACKAHLGDDWRELAAERSFAHPLGYGGKVDLHGPRFVLDFKTKDRLPDDLKAWDDQLLQLVAYKYGLMLDPAARLLNVFIGLDDGQVRIIEHDQKDFERAWGMFQALLNYWQLDKGYKP